MSTERDGPRIRADAARILASLLEQQGSLATLLEGDQPPLLRAICYGSCRWYHRLAVHLQSLLDKPLKTRDRDLHCLLLVGIYQLEYLRIPDHAAVNSTVAATATLNKRWARGLVNAVLRGYLRRRDELATAADRSRSSRHAHPDWLLDALEASWPDHWQQIVAANNRQAPMTLRCNLRRMTREELLTALQAADMPSHAGPLCGTSVYLEQPVNVHRLPGFDSGAVSVQDEASQIVPALLALGPGQRVLDACSAPGGKTAHMLEAEPGIELLALDNDARRLTRVQENLDRQELLAKLLRADASRPDQWWDGRGFDRILIDAPCTATGIIRRQPDIKLLRRDDDPQRMAAQQRQLLEALWPCLNPGGILLYTTCSVLPQENAAQMEAFLNSHPDAREQVIDADWGEACAKGRQLLPPADGEGPDGFYFARLTRDA